MGLNAINRIYVTLCAIFFAHSAVCSAATGLREIQITNPYDSQQPYLIVAPDPEGNSQRDEGIHRTKPDGSLQLLIKGRVLRGGANLGILEHLSLTKTSGRHESLVVIDGDLYLIQQSNRVDDAPEHSVIKIGSEHFPIIDPFTSEAISLPKIDNLHDVEIRIQDSEYSRQTVLISLKDPSRANMNSHQTGYTIGFVLKAKEEGLAWHATQDSSAFLLDNTFRTKASLNAMIFKKRNGPIEGTPILSTQVLNAYARKEKADPPTLTNWRLTLLQALKHISVGQQNNMDHSSLPYLDLTDGVIKLEYQPQEILPWGNLQLIQKYNPVTKYNWIEFPSILEADGRYQQLPGRLSLDDQNKLKFFNISTNGAHLALAVIDRTAYLLSLNHDGTTQSEHVRQTKIVGPSDSLTENISFHLLSKRDPIPSSESTFYLLLSSKLDGTKAYILRHNSLSTQLTNVVHVSNDFFPQHELGARGMLDPLRNNGDYLFDNITEILDPQTKKVYTQNSSRYTPFLNVTHSAKVNNPTYTHAVPHRTIDLTRSIKYHAYQTKGDQVTSGSVIVLDNAANYDQEVSGELLTHASAKGAIEPFWERKATQTVGDGETDIVVSMIDPNYQGGARGFSILTIVNTEVRFPSSQANNKPSLKPFVFEAQVSHPISDLVDVIAIKSSRVASEVQIFYVFKANEERNSPGVVFHQTIIFQKESGEPKIEKIVAINDTYISNPELRDRLRFAKNGRAYWVTTPKLEENQDGFKVKELATGIEVLVRSTEGRNLKLITVEQLNKETGDQRGYSNPFKLTWETHSTSTVKEYFKERGYFQDSKDGKKARSDEKEIKQFPLLRSDLDDFADYTKPKKHVILLTSDDEKIEMIEAMVNLFDKSNAHWNLKDQGRMKPYLLRTSRAEQVDFNHNISEIIGTDAKRAAIIADAQDLLSINTPSNSEEQESHTQYYYSSTDPELKARPHALSLLAAEGATIDIDNPKPELGKAKCRVLIVASVTELKRLKEQLAEVGQSHLLSNFEINRKHFSLNWRIWPTKSPKARSDIVNYVGSASSAVEDRVVPGLLQNLNTLADVKEKPKQVMIVLPDHLKSFVKRTIFSSWANADEKNPDISWSQHNSRLLLHEMSLRTSDTSNNPLDQSQILAELEAIRDRSVDQRSVLVVDAALMTHEKNARLVNFKGSGERNSSTFTVQDPAVEGEEEQAPHLLYLLQDEGRKHSLPEFKAKLSEDKTASVIILATQKELASLKAASLLEQRYGLLSGIEMLNLEPPSLETKVSIAENILNSSGTKGFRIEFDEQNRADFEKLTDAERRRKLLTYLVSRVETLSTQHKQESIDAFLRAIHQFKRTILEDVDVRTTEVINKKVVEYSLSKTFGIPLNLNILPPDDPLAILSKENKAAQALQEAGFMGSLGVKLNYIRTIASQTRSSGNSRNIPSSIVLFGSSSSGKTFLFKSLVKMLKLREYDWNAEDPTLNEDAEAMIVEFIKIRGRDSKDKNPEDNDGKSYDKERMYQAEEIIRSIEHFIASPRGFRGYLLLDDVHKAPPKERWKVLSFIQSFYDAPNGIITVTDVHGVKQEVSLKNFNIQMTVNPPEDPQVIAKLGNNPTNEQLIVERIKADDCPFDLSALKRWSLIVNLNRFPVSAKAPALRESLSTSAKDEFNVGNRLLVVLPQTINEVVQNFRDTNAREFIGEATSRLIASAINDGSSPSKIDLIVPRRMVGLSDVAKFDPYSGDMSNTGGGSERDTDRLARFVRESMISVPVQSTTFEGKPFFLSLMVDSYRVMLHEALIKAASSDPNFVEHGNILLGPFLHAAMTNIIDRPRMYLSDLRLDPSDFGIGYNIGKTKQFNRIVENIDNKDRDFFPIDFREEAPFDSLYQSFINHKVSAATTFSRSKLMIEMVHKASDLLKRLLAAQLNIETVSSLPGPAQWLKGLVKGGEPAHRKEKISRELLQLYIKFIEDMSSRKLLEMQGANPHVKHPSPFALARLFFMILDKAQMSLPWGKTVNFVIKGIELAAIEADFGQLPGVQHYLFGSDESIVIPAVHEGIMQAVASNEAFRGMTTDEVNRQQTQFGDDCALYFAR